MLQVKTLLIILNIVLGLLLESHGAQATWHWAEPLVVVITFLHFLFYLHRPEAVGGEAVTRSTLLACLILATIGELILSEVWLLYEYRSGFLPMFVPTGHVLLFIAGIQVSRTRLGAYFLKIAPALIAGIIVVHVYKKTDVISIPMFVIFCICIMRGRNPALYATMMLMALALELLGTHLGTWRWHETSFHLSSYNPPVAAGVFYSLLDLLTLGLLVSGKLDPVPSTEILDEAEARLPIAK
jgi:hypothetical protein